MHKISLTFDITVFMCKNKCITLMFLLHYLFSHALPTLQSTTCRICENTRDVTFPTELFSTRIENCRDEEQVYRAVSPVVNRATRGSIRVYIFKVVEDDSAPSRYEIAFVFAKATLYRNVVVSWPPTYVSHHIRWHLAIRYSPRAARD